MKTSRFIILASLLLFITVKLFSGSDFTNPVKPASNYIKGEISDGTTNEKLTGVAITLDGTDKKIYSDVKGDFIIDGLKPGEYQAHFNLISYKEHKVKISVKETENQKISVILESIEP